MGVRMRQQLALQTRNAVAIRRPTHEDTKLLPCLKLPSPPPPHGLPGGRDSCITEQAAATSSPVYLIKDGGA